jgi:integrase
MARLGNRLSARRVKTARATDGPAMLADGAGLYLRVEASGTRSWIYRFQLRGRRRDMGLGSASLYTLAEARQKAWEARRLVADGIDPVEQRAGAKAAVRVATAKAMTFRQCAEAYVQAHQAGWGNPKHTKQWSATLETYVFPTLGSLPVQAVDTGLIMKAIEPTWATKTETMSRVRGRIESVLDWAAARGYRVGDNPARWKGHLENLLPKKSKVARVAHHPALPYDEVSDFVTALRQQPGIAARALEFLILTAARTGEVLGARWSEIDLEACLWVIPAERMKARKKHSVPLSAAALAVLSDMQAVRQNEFVFPGRGVGRPLDHSALLAVLRRMGRGDRTTAHGFRSCFSDWCAEQTATPSEVREMALAHAVTDKVEAAYRRGDLFQKRRDLMEAWARYVAGGGRAGNVTELRKAAV